MILIHIQKLTPRVSYIFKHICKRMLGVPVRFTTKIEEFIAFEGAKLSYGKHPLGKELYFQSISLLFEQGINEIEVPVKAWQETVGLFPVHHNESALPFDIFAGSFYLISRYEEYLPHRKDEYGRFIAEESLAFTHHFLEQPVVDIWAQKFKGILIDRFPQLIFNANQFQVRPVIIVSQTFVYLQKGIIRTLGGVLKDMTSGRIDKVMERAKVMLNLKEDPYNTFDFIINLQKKIKKQAVVFFSLGDYSNYEKNVVFNNEQHKKLIKHVSDYLEVGTKISFDAIDQISLVKKEKRRMESIVHRPLQKVLCSYFKISLPTIYRSFIELEIFEDYSMGYTGHSGFRAGTCTPFLFYDLDYEIQTPLVVYSFCFAPKNFSEDFKDRDIIVKFDKMMHKIREVNGTFIPVFSNGIFGNRDTNRDWKKIAEHIWIANE